MVSCAWATSGTHTEIATRSRVSAEGFRPWALGCGLVRKTQVRSQEPKAESPSASSDFCGDRRELVVVVVDGVPPVDFTVRERRIEADAQRPRQPDRREWLSHFHRRVHAIDPDQPSSGEEVELDVLEVVLEYLVFGGIDPERDDRALVHLGLNLGVAFPQLLVRPSASLAEQLGRVVLDLEHVSSFELLASGEGVVIRIERESQEIGGRDEARLERLTKTFLGEGRRARGVLHGVVALLALEAPLLPLVLHLHIQRFPLASIRFADRHTVDAQRALDKPAVTREPRRLTSKAKQWRRARAGQLERLALFEDVLLELLPVVVAPFKHPRHESVEVRRRCGRGSLPTDRNRRGDQSSGEDANSEDTAFHG